MLFSWHRLHVPNVYLIRGGVLSPWKRLWFKFYFIDFLLCYDSAAFNVLLLKPAI